MPYATNDRLPAHAQDIYREALAHRVAWAAVKKKDEKRGDAWVPR